MEDRRESETEIMEIDFEDVQRMEPWRQQITLRGIVASLVIGVIYSVIVMKLNLTTGLVPNLNVSAALLAFVFIKTWTQLLHKAGFISKPFTRQENTVIQTCAVACYSIALAGGFGSYLLGLNRRTYEQAGVTTPGNTAVSHKEPGVGWMIGFMFVSNFVGLLALVPLRKMMIIDCKLSYPSGTATAILINGFHTKKGDKNAKKQVRGFVKLFSMSFIWGFFQWFYSGVSGSNCGFSSFPTFGLAAWRQTFYFDFSATYIGAGMICSHLVNLSLLFGAVLSWGVMWPLIGGLKGKWYPGDIKTSSMKSLNGYKVFIAIALILGDGLYNFLKVIYFTSKSMYAKNSQKSRKTFPVDQNESVDVQLRNEVFVRESIPVWVACVGYIFFSIVAVIIVPLMFPQLKWYYVIVAYMIAPSLSFCNAYGAGLTDMNMAYNYGKVALFVLAAMSGQESGVVAGLVGCGLIKSIVSVSSDLMHDFKTSHLTLTSPRSMLLSQAIGTAMGCIIGPLTFFLFYKAFDVGNPEGEFKAPYALVYRNMAILGVEGFSALPQHCLQFCYAFFAFAVLLNLVRDLSPKGVGKWIPLPMAMAVPFLVGAYFAIDMCIGSLAVFVWKKIDNRKASLMIPAVASGLICGDGMWILPSSVLALAKADREGRSGLAGTEDASNLLSCQKPQFGTSPTHQNQSPLRLLRRSIDSVSFSDFSRQTAPMASADKVHTFEDVSRHNQIKDCWLIIAGKVYDVTPFMEEHPGGEEVLLSATGKDATDDFEDVGHSDAAREQMESFCIGTINISTVPKKRTYAPPQQAHYNQDKTMDFVIKMLQFVVPLLILGLALAVRSYTKKDD